MIKYYLLFASSLWSIGLFGLVANRNNLIKVLMSIEIMLLATNTLFITFANMYSDLVGQIIVFFILTVAACEAAVGLALIVILFRNTGSIELQTLRNNHG